MRVPLGTVIEDLDHEVEALSRMVREQVDPRPAEGTGREKIVLQVFFDTEVKVNVDGQTTVGFLAQILLRREEGIQCDGDQKVLKVARRGSAVEARKEDVAELLGDGIAVASLPDPPT